MAQAELILDRYEPLGTVGAGGFGTVQVAWDPRIQRKVAIKTIQLNEADARRASLPGAQAVAGSGASTSGRWRGIQPWDEYLAENYDDVGWGQVASHGDVSPDDHDDYPAYDDSSWDIGDSPESLGRLPDDALGTGEPFTALAHLPGLDEARTAAKLQDLRIVTVFDFEVRDGVAYLIMEYVEGITLTRLLVEYEAYLTLDVVAAVFDAVAGALAVAHKAGVLHLDIKPDNIIINVDGQVKVTDFGLATLADASGSGRAGGGTIGYMPLEQMRRQPLDARTDEWSLASVAYEMLSGDNPFRAASLDDAQRAIEDAELVLPSLCWENIDEQVDDVIFYALDPDRELRYATVADFAEEMDKFLGDPEAGKRQLAAIVSDALGLEADPEDGAAWDDDDAYWEGAGEFDHDEDGASPPPRRFRLFGRGGRRDMPAEREEPDDGASAEWERPAAGGRAGRGKLVSRLLAAACLGVAAWLAVSGFTPLVALAGSQAAVLVAAVVAVALAVTGAVKPHVGVLVTGLMLGFAVVVWNQAVLGAALLVATLAWCYAYYRLGADGAHPNLLAAMGIALVAVLVALLVAVQPPLQTAVVVGVFCAAIVFNAAFVLAGDA